MKFMFFICCLSVTICSVLPSTDEKSVAPSDGSVRPDYMIKGGTGVQYTFPWKTLGQKTCVHYREEVSSFRITCDCYGDKIAAVVSRAGIHIETLLLFSSNKNKNSIMFSNLKKIIIPEKIGSEVRVTYLWKIRDQLKRCRMKKYKVKVEFRSYYGTVENLDLEDIDCPTEVDEFLRSIGDSADFGVENLLGDENQIVHDMDYHVNDKYKLKQTKPIKLGVSDEQGDYHTVICRHFAISYPPPGYPRTGTQLVPVDKSEQTIFTGSIIFKENNDFVIERFRVDSCSGSWCRYMNINREVLSTGAIEFTLVFLGNDGNCYSRIVTVLQSEQKGELVKKLVKKTKINRSELECVRCPKKWNEKFNIEKTWCGMSYNVNVINDWIRKKSGLDQDLEP